jgi:hypothetical protein
MCCLKRLDLALLPPLLINNVSLSPKLYTKFLGVTLDSRLNFKQHIQSITPKVSKSIGILCRLKKKLPTQTLKNLYYTFAYPYLTYGIEVWGCSCTTYLEPLFKLQKRIIRILSSSSFDAHTAPLFKSLNLLPLQAIYAKHVLLYVYKYEKHLIPHTDSPNNRLFVSSSFVNQYRTRQSNLLHIPFTRIEATRRAIRSRGPHLWNASSPYLMPLTINSTPLFNKLTTRFLLSPQSQAMLSQIV